MKSLRIILLAVFSVVSLLAFAQEDTSKTITMLPTIPGNKPCQCTSISRNLNLSMKEKMKVETMKEHACSMNIAVLNDNGGRNRKRGRNQHFSLKENMKSNTMKGHAGSMDPDVIIDTDARGNTNAIYQNLSLKEKMKREATKQKK